GMLVANQGDREAARSLLDEAVGLARIHGPPHLRAVCLSGRGQLALLDGDHPTARRYFEEALAVGVLRPQPLGHLAHLAVVEGDTVRATTYLRDAARERQREGSGVILELASFAEVAVAEG